MNSLKRRSEFLQIQKHGFRIRKQWFTIVFSDKAQHGIRFGWVVPKKIGTAVVRNKIKRWLKEHLRSVSKKELVEAEYVFIFHSNFSQVFSKIDFKEFCLNVDLALSIAQERLKSRGTFHD